MRNEIITYSKLIAVFVFVLFSVHLSGQEYLTGTDRNAELKAFDHEATSSLMKQQSSLSLPFFDDFSVLSILPDPGRWIDQKAYVNDNYAANQPTIGVATLDAIDENGDLYAFPDTASVMPGDTLTSQLIDASAFTAADNIMISFFIQGGGLGNTPQTKDSIILQFRFINDTLNEWRSVWSKPGTQMDTFQEVRIMLNQDEYIHDSTQFRFINFFSLEYAGMNCDHWNIDYVNMDANRSIEDSLIDEVAYTHNLNNILGTFSAVPSDHFKTYYSQIIDNIEYRITNYTEEIMNNTT